MDRVRNAVYTLWYGSAILFAGRSVDLVSRRIARYALLAAVVCWLISRLPVFHRHVLPSVPGGLRLQPEPAAGASLASLRPTWNDRLRYWSRQIRGL